MANFLDLTTGLPALWAKIKSKFYTKAEVDALIPEDEVMVVNISWDDVNQKYVADKTAQEIVEFVDNGGVAVVNNYSSKLLCNNVISDVTENYYFAGFYYAAVEDDDNGTIAYGGSITIKHENGIESVDITQGNKSIPSPAGDSDGLPIMDGTANRGDSINYARADHVHPSDTSRAAVADVLTKTNTTSYTPTADYNPATKKYVDDSVSGISTDLVGLTDTTISSPANGQILTYDSTTSKWINSTPSSGVTETRVNELIAAALAQYGDGDTATYGYNDASEVNY